MATEAGRVRPARPVDYGIVAVWFALVAGAVEVATHLVRRYGFHQFTWASHHVVWMTPLSYLLLLVPPAVLVAVVAWRWPRLVPLPLLAGLYAAVVTATLLILLTNQRLYLASVVLVAIAVGVQVFRWSTQSGESFRRFIRRTTPLLAAVVLAVAGISEGAWWLTERQALRRLAASDPKAPNILLLILDTVRAENLGLYGYQRPTTPMLDGFAARGAVFERAFAASSWTLQSHASFFTGRLPNELSADFVTPLDAAPPTLAEVLRDHGYLTAGFVANHTYASAETGLARGFIHYEDYRLTLHQVLLSSELRQIAEGGRSKMRIRDHHPTSAAVETDLALTWLSRNAGQGHPFFAFINYMDAHLPYRTPPEVVQRFVGAHPKVDGYDAAIAYLDQELGGLFRRLEASGLLANTIVIITSDHGEQLGEHGLSDHGNSLYIQLLHVPLVVVGPGRVPAGVRVADPVSLRDIPATVLALAGFAGSAAMGGRSLTRYWDSTVSPGARAESLLVAEVARRPPGAVKMLNGAGKMWSVVGGQHHYIASHDGSEELFNYWSDPGESIDIMNAPGAAALVAPFRAEAIRVGAPARRGSSSP
ncbi:MAG: sulfatase [Gemmatimonadota bacterium]